MTHERLEELRQIAGGIGGPKSGYMDELIDEIDRLRAENRQLHVALFHVENGLSHPDEAVRKLIQAATRAKS